MIMNVLKQLITVVVGVCVTILAGGSIVHDARRLDESVVGLPGLDMFGRTRDVAWWRRGFDGGVVMDAALYRAQYTHDAAGNRVSALVMQAAVPSVSDGINVRSQVHRYDQLNRLVGSDVGTLAIDANGAAAIQSQDRLRADAWNLDLLGNWVGGAAAGTTGPPTADPSDPGWYGRFSTGNLDGAGTPWSIGSGAGGTGGDDARGVRHEVNGRNQIADLAFGDFGAGGGGGNPPTTSTNNVYYDAAGNLLFDGTYVYQYDAWNRLVQVGKGHSTGESWPFGTVSDVTGLSNPNELTNMTEVLVPPSIAIDELVKHHTYDGLGRLVRTQSPWPVPVPTWSAAGGQVRVERFYYDGLRRVQEVVTNPLPNVAGGTEEEGEIEAQANQALLEGTDPSGATLDLEQAAAEMSSAGATISREYIWGTGDGYGGADELLVQFGPQTVPGGPSGSPTWVLQDGGGDNVALCDLNGTDGQGHGGLARVVAQWVYDAYGSVVTAEHLAPHALLRCGHKSQFIDRLDVGVAAGGTGANGSVAHGTTIGTPGANAEPPRLVPFAHAVHHVRNRVYSPQLGRWLQGDPNASGLTLMESVGYHGQTHNAAVMSMDMETLYGDGMSLYAYLGSNPWQRGDPLGLEWDPFSMVDEYVEESAAERSAFLSQLGRGALAAAYLAATISSYIPIPLVSMAGDLALGILEGQDPSDIAISMAFGVVANKGLSAALGFASRVGAKALDVAAQYAAKSFSKVAARMGRASGLAARGVAAAKGALKFVAGGPCDTQVYIAYRGSDAVYVGITSQGKRPRLSQHNSSRNRRGFDDLEFITPPLPRRLAMAIETVLIISNPQFENKSKSIGNKQLDYSSAIHAGTSWLMRNNVRIGWK